MDRYTLLLRYDNNKFYLAPRHSISVEEPDDMESLEDSGGCNSCGSSTKKSFKFKLYFDSACSLASAWALYNQLLAFLELACNKDLILERRVQDETSQTYKVTKFQLHMVEPKSQYNGSRRVLSMEFTVSLTTWPPVGAGVVSVG